MLTPEQARDQLQRVAVPDVRQRQTRRGWRLLGHAATVAHALYWGREAPSFDDVGRELDELSDRARRRVFHALHPGLGDLLDLAWIDLRQLPYTRGYTRRGFRAPRHPELTRGTRAWRTWYLLNGTAEYEQPPAWFAAWAGRLPDFVQPELGLLLAVAVDHGHEEVYDLLLAAAHGGHEVALMGRHVPTALLSCARPDAWEVAERMLLSARRQEGLRQVILEAVDLAQPEAFRRMLRLVVDHELTRFAAAVRAAGVWLGEPFEIADRALVDALLTDLAGMLGNAAARADALTGADPGRVYLALWATAFDDAVDAVEHGQQLLGHPDADHRLAAARVLAAADLPMARAALVRALDDADRRVAAVACDALPPPEQGYDDATAAALRGLLDRLDRPQELQVGLWKPEQLTLAPAEIADQLAFGLGEAPPTVLADIAPRMSTAGRLVYAGLLADDPAVHRGALLGLVGDRSESVRRRALDGLAHGPAPSGQESRALEGLLQRRGADLRRGVLTLLLRQPDAGAAESAERLLAGTEPQLEAGRELQRELRSAGRAAGHVEKPPITPYSLVDHGLRTPARRPERGLEAVTRWNGGVARVLTSLDGWLAEHRDVEVRVESWEGEDLRLVSDLAWLRGPDPHADWTTQRDRFPLRELVEPWWERTSPQLSDGGMQALLAWPSIAASNVLLAPRYRRGGEDRVPRWMLRLADSAGQLSLVREMSYAPIVAPLLAWFATRELRAEWVDPLLDAVEAVLAGVPDHAVADLPTVADEWSALYADAATGFDWRGRGGLAAWLVAAAELEALRPDLWSAEQRGRLWLLARFVDEPRGTYDPRSGARDRPGAGQEWYGVTDLPRRPARYHPPLRLATRAVEDGVASRADVLDLLVGEYVIGDDPTPDGWAHGEKPLAELTRRTRPAWLGGHPWLAGVADDICGRTVDAEVARGELATPWSPLVDRLRSVEGADTVVRLLAALGRQKLVRGYAWTDVGKASTLSRLIRSCFPRRADTAEQFAAAVRAHGLPERRLLELAVYAPQWADVVEATLGQAGLADAVYWLHGHTKDDRWHVDDDVRAEWEAEVHERTPLAAIDLLDGAIDVEWLARVRRTLGDERFDELLRVAKYASSSGGHKRAELYAQAVRGNLDRDALLSRIRDRRHQDAVRALGLLPLPDEENARKAELLARYHVLQEWRRQGRTYGPQRRASEALAVRVGMENLARAAGYRDPQRLAWAMEAEAVRDLSAGPIVIADGDVTVTLSIDERGAPALDVRRGDRALRSLPARLRKDERVAELNERAAALREQARRVRASLEEASVRGDRFTVVDLAELMAHPMVAPILRDLVVVSQEGLLGFPRDGGRLMGRDGAERAADGSPVRVAHPVDLLDSQLWPEWQRACFAQRVRQPFKQLFRELYVPTAAERDGATMSERYAGQQVNPGQATALLGSRGWVMARDEGALRTFHDEGLTARLAALGGIGTPAEVAGMTIETVYFTPVGEWQPVPLETVPLRLFSEVMRDVDLVVSVAHASGTNPETSASTVELRGSLVRETADLLGLNNVELTDHHVLVAGKLGSYSIHLGSGVVHRRPGNALCIIPVGAQHRGRLFLPFADDDPRTAEIVSKVALLARDDQIKDPTIVEQLRA